MRIAIITARGGSKRIPKKNIREFCGRPIIAYSIETAIESGIFDKVMVSTDSEEIAGVAREFGAEIPFMRSVRNSDDISGTDDVLIEVIEEYKRRGEYFDELCCIYPTAPFITPEKLLESHNLLNNISVYSVVPMVAFSFPPQRGVIINNNGLVEAVDAVAISARSQDLATIYHDAGQFYWIKTKEFLASRKIMGNHTKAYFVSETEVQDIDNESDWIIAEMKYRAMKNMG